MIKTSRPGRDGTVRVTFALPIDDPGGAVSVVGNFNDWNPYTHPMRKRANQTRSAAVTVRAGSTLHFRYLGEGGVWFDDETVDAQHGVTVRVGPGAASWDRGGYRADGRGAQGCGHGPSGRVRDPGGSALARAV